MLSQALKVTEIMRRKVLSVDSASDGYEAGKLMYDEEGECVLVENNKTVIGIITWRDFIKEILTSKAPPSETRVRHMMSSPVHMIDSEETVENAAALMSSKRVRRLPVLQDENIIGIVFDRDVAKVSPSRWMPREIAEKGRISEDLDVMSPLSEIPRAVKKR